MSKMFPYKIKENKNMGSQQQNAYKETFLPYKVKAIMTVECSIVLPIFIFLIISVLLVIKIAELNVDINDAVLNCAKELAQYAYVKDNKGADENIVKKLGIGFGESVYVNSEIKKLVGEEKLDWTNGIKCICREDDNEMIDIFTYYSFEMPLNIFNINNINTVSRARVKKWTGYDISKDIGNEKTVYVTRTGTVYHTSYNCTHLKLSIKSVAGDMVDNIRNNENEKYHRCELCGKKGSMPGIVYVTNEGNKYHFSIGCSGLKRSIIQVPISEVGNRKLCSRCKEAVGD